MRLSTLLAALAIGLLLACLVGPANAQQIYKWKDASGVVHFSETPPTNGTHYTKMRLSGEPEVSSNPGRPASATAATTSDRGTGRAPAADRTNPGTQPDTASNRAKLCRQLSSNIALLTSKQPVIAEGSNGKRHVMSKQVRQQQLTTARAQQTQYCVPRGT